MTSPMLTFGFSLGMGVVPLTGAYLTSKPQSRARVFSRSVPDRNIFDASGIEKCPLDRGLGDGNRLRHRTASFSRALILVECRVGALQKLLGCFTGLVVGPAAGAMQANFVLIEGELKALQAAKHVVNLFGAAFRQDSHEFITA